MQTKSDIVKPKDLPSHQKEILISRIKEMGPWFHNIEIAKDVYTNPNSDYPLSRWKVLKQYLPERLDGKVCLDIGCSSGFFSMKLRERKAEQIVGIDFGEQGNAIQQAEFAKETLGADRVEFRKLSVYDVEKLETRFDYVLFLGVFYHLRYPLLALDELRKITKEKLIIQTITTEAIEKKPDDNYFRMPDSYKGIKLRDDAFYLLDFPKLHFLEGQYLGDPTVEWIGNIECVTAMLRYSGFTIEKVQTLDHEVFVVCS